MDEWHRRLARELVAETPAGSISDGAAILEIGFGQARTAVAYVLELARAHRLPATGSVEGDDIWLQFGDRRVRFTLNRRDGHVVVLRTVLETNDGEARQEGALVRWEDERSDVIDSEGASVDLAEMARAAIDTLVDEWRAHSGKHKVAPRTSAECDDEPTRG